MQLLQRKLAVFLLAILFSGCTPAKIVSIQFAPSEKAPEPIIALYDNSGKYIHLAIYRLTKDEFSEALIRAHWAWRRGQGFDRSHPGEQPQSSKDEKLEAAGVELRRSKGDGFMHNRFAIIDGIIIYTGSYNHTSGATLKNDENYIIIKDIGIAHIYETQFQEICEKHK